jgi:hypothetical protein
MLEPANISRLDFDADPVGGELIGPPLGVRDLSVAQIPSAKMGGAERLKGVRRSDPRGS